MAKHYLEPDPLHGNGKAIPKIHTKTRGDYAREQKQAQAHNEFHGLSTRFSGKPANWPRHMDKKKRIALRDAQIDKTTSIFKRLHSHKRISRALAVM